MVVFIGLLAWSSGVRMARADVPVTRKVSAKERAPSSPGFKTLLVRMVFFLIVVCLIAYLVLRFGVRRLTNGNRGDEDIEVVSRCDVGPNRSVLVVRVLSRLLIVADGDDGLRRLGELSESEAQAWLGTGDETDGAT